MVSCAICFALRCTGRTGFLQIFMSSFSQRLSCDRKGHTRVVQLQCLWLGLGVVLSNGFIEIIGLFWNASWQRRNSLGKQHGFHQLSFDFDRSHRSDFLIFIVAVWEVAERAFWKPFAASPAKTSRKMFKVQTVLRFCRFDVRSSGSVLLKISSPYQRSFSKPNPKFLTLDLRAWTDHPEIPTVSVIYKNMSSNRFTMLLSYDPEGLEIIELRRFLKVQQLQLSWEPFLRGVFALSLGSWTCSQTPVSLIRRSPHRMSSQR